MMIDKSISTMLKNQGLEVVARNKQRAASLIELKLSLSNRCMETVGCFLNERSSKTTTNLLLLFGKAWKLMQGQSHFQETCMRISMLTARHQKVPSVTSMFLMNVFETLS